MEPVMDLATIDKLLTTTRSVRKRLDFTRPVEPEVLQHCLDIAIQAPMGGDIPRYHFLVITDPAIRAELAALYRTAMADYLAGCARTDRPAAPTRPASAIPYGILPNISTRCPCSFRHVSKRGRCGARAWAGRLPIFSPQPGPSCWHSGHGAWGRRGPPA
jgi:nitroreductase